MTERSYSTITQRGQTTIPAEVRERMNLHPGDRLAYIQDERGRWLIEAQPGMSALRGIGRGYAKRKASRDFEAETHAAEEAWAHDAATGGIRGGDDPAGPQ